MIFVCAGEVHASLLESRGGGVPILSVVPPLPPVSPVYGIGLMLSLIKFTQFQSCGNQSVHTLVFCYNLFLHTTMLIDILDNHSTLWCPHQVALPGATGNHPCMNSRC